MIKYYRTSQELKCWTLILSLVFLHECGKNWAEKCTFSCAEGNGVPDFIFTIKTCTKITLLWHSGTPYNMSKWLRKENKRRKTLSGFDFESQIFLEKCNETCLWLSYFQHFPTPNVYLSKAWFRTHTRTHARAHTHTRTQYCFLTFPFPGPGEDIIRDRP